MSEFQIHTLDSAPRGSRELLAGLQREIGMIPNLAASMAESPELLRGFLALREVFNKGSFGPAEVQALALTNAVANGCAYCTALHATFALKLGVAEESVKALRRGDAPQEPRLAALTSFSRRLVTERGRVGADDLRVFLAAGFTKAQALEVVLGIAASIMPNFAHHLTECPIDEPFRASRAVPA